MPKVRITVFDESTPNNIKSTLNIIRRCTNVDDLQYNTNGDSLTTIVDVQDVIATKRALDASDISELYKMVLLAADLTHPARAITSATKVPTMNFSELIRELAEQRLTIKEIIAAIRERTGTTLAYRHVYQVQKRFERSGFKYEPKKRGRPKAPRANKAIKGLPPGLLPTKVTRKGRQAEAQRAKK